MDSVVVEVGILIFPGVQQLDATAPFEVFASEPRCRVRLIGAHDAQPLASATGMKLIPDVSIAECDTLDVLIVPGGAGVNRLLKDEILLSWLRERGPAVRYLCSVCTGALVLGAAGLLRGKRATTHWNAMDFLPVFGAIPVEERVVQDGTLFTAGGVTSGIDFALVLLTHLFDQSSAEKVQLFLEYCPSPPFSTGHPSTASEELVTAVKARAKKSRSEREQILGWKP